MLLLVSENDVLVTINTVELVGIVYLAIALSYLRERISKVEGREEGKEKQHEMNHADMDKK
jgi:hypothetical protein